MKYNTKDEIIKMNPEIYCNSCNQHPFQLETKRLNPFQVIELSCDFLCVNQSDVISKKRHRNLCDARHMISDLLYNDGYLNLSLSNIGLILGGRDHTTILNSKKIVKNLIFSNDDFREKLMKLHLHVYHTTRYFKH